MTKEERREKFLNEHKNNIVNITSKYKNYKKWRELNPIKNKAHKLVFISLRNKSLKKETCKTCGALKTEAHHEDYNKPLDVIWYCKKHHLERHKELKNQHLT